MLYALFFKVFFFAQLPTVLGSSIKLNPFSVKMLTMHRWFDISAAEQDLKYKPVIGFKEG